MKNLFLAGLFLLSSNVFAATLVNVKNLTNKTLDTAAQELTKMETVTHSGMKKISDKEKEEVKQQMRKNQKMRENAVAQALHTVCGFFDDGVSVSLNTKDANGSENAVNDFTDSSSVNKGDADYTKLLSLVSTMNKQVGVEVYSGSASGNNTAGTVLGIYDVNTNEIAVWANTNCGSDD